MRKITWLFHPIQWKCPECGHVNEPNCHSCGSCKAHQQTQNVQVHGLQRTSAKERKARRRVYAEEEQ